MITNREISLTNDNWGSVRVTIFAEENVWKIAENFELRNISSALMRINPGQMLDFFAYVIFIDFGMRIDHRKLESEFFLFE